MSRLLPYVLVIAVGSAAGLPTWANAQSRTAPPENLVLNYHLMHPGGDSLPGDPNAAFYLDGVYH